MGEINISNFVKNINLLTAKMKLLTINIFFLLICTGLFAQAPQNWAIDEINPGADLTLNPDGSFFSDGIRSCRLHLNSGAVPYLKSDVYNVSAGASYEFSFDVFDQDTAGQVRVYADFYDASGFNVFGQTPVYSSDSSEWQTIGWDGVIPDQAVSGYVLIKFYCQPDLYHFTKTATVWIDHVQFRQAGGDNLVANGSFEEWIVGVEENGSSRNQLSIYPNPADDYVNIDFPDVAETIVISDLTGREVLRTSPKEKVKNQIDIRQLKQGIYIVAVMLEDNSVLKRKLIKN
jgi:hypothetical protein